MTEVDLSTLNKEEQIDEMRQWFYRNYERPEENTPYEGGFIYIWGGPYEATDVLHSTFCNEVPEEVIDELAEELESESWEWAAIPKPEDFYDYELDAITSNSDFYENFKENIDVIEKLLNNGIPAELEKKYLMMLYVNVITSLETYLSDAFINTVLGKEEFTRKMVETNPDLANEKFSLKDIYEQYEKIELKVKQYLLDIIWHNLAKIKPLYKATLDVDFPTDLKDIFRAITIRHDIVHRNGKSKTGEVFEIEKSSVLKLIEKTNDFVKHIDDQLVEIE